MNMNGRLRAFTLIELLIVVAIIAILAAIAVPNFLEAQVRAKITRVKSEHRTIATGIESYLVDHNVVMGTHDWQDALGITADEGRLYSFAKLTTPVAYLTSIMVDPFFVHEKYGGRPKGPYEFRTFNTFSRGNWPKPRLRGYLWSVNSIGPILDRESGVDPGMLSVLRGLDDKAKGFVYDSTNGTKSKGFIFRTNKGEYTWDDAPPAL